MSLATPENVQKLQTALHDKAKKSPDFRFYALYDLIKMWLKAPVEETDEHGRKRRNTRNRDEGRGSPQGSPISPLLSNLYMRRFVLGWKKLGHERRLGAHIVNYADDLVICCRGRAEELWPRCEA